MELEDIKNYLKVDYDDEDNFIEELIEFSQIYIDENVGEGYKNNENGVKLANILRRKIIKDTFDNRGSYVDGNIARNIKREGMVNTILDKLALMGYNDEY